MYIREIDGLRCIAVSLVIIHHWGYTSFLPLLDLFPIGFIGVNLFFAISGFLITHILLTNRCLKECSNWSIVKAFYIRRALRIFPLYYLSLAVFVALNYQSILKCISSYVFYYCNITYYSTNELHGNLSPRWSLAVEEQYYLFWPWVILLTPRARIKYIFPIIITTAVLFRIVMVHIFPHKDLVQFLTISNLDSLGAGGALAYIMVFHKTAFASLRKYALYLFGFGLGMVLLYCYYPHDGIVHGILSTNFKAIGCTSISVSVLALALIEGGLPVPILSFLKAGPIVYLGKISYGLYIYHSLVHVLLDHFKVAGVSLLRSDASLVLLLLLMSSISWYFFEKPLNGLKRQFAY